MKSVLVRIPGVVLFYFLLFGYEAHAQTGSNENSFSISSSPSTLSISTGGQQTSTVTLAPSSGFNANVSLTVTSPPSGISVSFDPATVTPKVKKSILTISVGKDVVSGSYPLTISAASRQTVQRTQVKLNVSAPDNANASAATPTSCDGCFLSIGIGANITNKNNSDYVNTANILQTTHLGNTSPQFLAGISYTLPWREINPLIWDKASLYHKLGCNPNHFQDSGEAVSGATYAQSVYCYPWRAFVNVKFTPDGSSTFSGFTFGLSHRVARSLDLMLGLSFAPFSQPTPGFRAVAIQTVETQQGLPTPNPHYTQFSLNAMQHNYNNAFDGFPTVLINPDGTQGAPIYSGTPLASHYVAGGFAGIAVPVNFKTILGINNN